MMTATTVTTAGTLSAEDVAALRLAHSVTFHHYQGCAFIRAYTQPSGHPATFTRREQLLFPEPGGATGERSREITVSGSLSGYGDNGESRWRADDGDTVAAAFYMIHTAQFVTTWVTVADLLTVGDTVTLQWLADNNTRTIRDAELHADELRITTTKGKRTRVFAIGNQVTPDNSARMIRRYGK